MQRFEDSRQIAGIQTEAALDKLRYILDQDFQCSDISDRGPSVRLHRRIVINPSNELVLKIYGNSTVNCSAPPRAPSGQVNELVRKVFLSCEASAYTITDRGLLSVSRAKEILEWVERFPEQSDVARIIVVVLSDSVIEMLVTEMMKDKGIRDQQSLREGIPYKLDKLKDQGLPVYSDSNIKQLRILRNKAVHEGNLPYENEVAEAKALARDFFDHY